MRRVRRQTSAEARPGHAPVTTSPVGGRFRPLAPTEEARIVADAFAILETIGMGSATPQIDARLKGAGVGQRADGRLLFPRSVVEAAVERSPSTVDVPGFVADRGVSVGGSRVHIGTGGAAVTTLDSVTGAYRDSTLADLAVMIRVLEESPNIHYGVRPLIARDMDDDLSLDLNTAFACAASTTKPIGISFTSAATVDPVIDLFDVALGGAGRFAAQPFCMAVAVHVVPPLRFSADGCEVIEAAIRRGMVIQTCSAGQAGATSPASLAGSLAQGLAEILAVVVLIDAIAPGHPAIHAFMPFISDLRTGAMSGGSGEAAVTSAAAAQLLNGLGLPNAVSAGITDSKLGDVQTGYEKGYTVSLAAHAGAGMVQLSVGMLGSIMVASPEALVVDDELCGAILRSVRGIEVEPGGVDLDMIEGVVSGDGHYLGQAQTLELMRTEYVYPTIGDRSSVSEWLDAGSPTAWSRAQTRVSEILSSPRPSHIDRRAEAEIRRRHDIRVPEPR